MLYYWCLSCAPTTLKILFAGVILTETWGAMMLATKIFYVATSADKGHEEETDVSSG